MQYQAASLESPEAMRKRSLIVTRARESPQAKSEPRPSVHTYRDVSRVRASRSRIFLLIPHRRRVWPPHGPADRRPESAKGFGTEELTPWPLLSGEFQSASQTTTTSGDSDCIPGRKTRSATTVSQLTTQISELTSSLAASRNEVLDLKSVIADLEGSNRGQAVVLADLARVNDALCSELDAVKSTASACASRLRETENALSAEHEALKKATKRIHRLVNDKKKAADAKRKSTKATTTSQSSLEADIQSHLATILSLSTDNARLQGSLSDLKENSAELKRLRAERKAFKMQARRAQESLAAVRSEFTAISTWDAKSGLCSMQTRRLVLRISGNGCPEHKVKDVILSCAEVFGINVKNLTLSARTVGRMKKEGGYISLIQIGREITMMYGPLGSARIHIRYHPNSNPASFSALERYRRNNTEAFVDKYITVEDLLHVMREVRKEDANGENAAFRKAVVEELESKARVHREKVRVATEKKLEREANLRATGVERDRVKIKSMTVPQLKAQYDVYKLIVKDDIIRKTTLVSIPPPPRQVRCSFGSIGSIRSIDSFAAAGADVEMGDVEKDELSGEEEDEELYH
ncbi:hypothetical protein R3P38DRAFT_2772051 [Favolaschia claudopus]|uniref:Uncharacterized protein n=1 Tax=Favolaschia claudopus TaxID=2862362 RepID=A0AAW0C7U8_9AGAR